MNLVLADNGDEDPIVWQRGKLLPCGQIRVFVMRASDEERLLKAFGREWLDAHLREQEAEIEKWGVQ